MGRGVRHVRGVEDGVPGEHLIEPPDEERVEVGEVGDVLLDRPGAFGLAAGEESRIDGDRGLGDG